MKVTIIAEHGTHLLIACGDRFALIERRNGRLYSCHEGEREGIPVAELNAVSNILDERDWTDQATAQAAFNEIIERGTELAEGMR